MAAPGARSTTTEQAHARPNPGAAPHGPPRSGVAGREGPIIRPKPPRAAEYAGVMQRVQDRYEELCCYTLAHGHAAFIHQHVVDAQAAQAAGEHTKPIAITFALAGLYLHVE